MLESLRYRRRRRNRAKWVTPLANTGEDPLRSFGLFAVVASWMEQDIIAATVRNAITQGCERVYLVDNKSPDQTVTEALAAGATLARSYASRVHQEQRRSDLMNEVMQEVSEADGRQHIWWLFLDSDEFPHGPGGQTLREYLSGLDARFRVVGSVTYEHYPTRTPAYLPGFHPIEFQPMCCEHWAINCPKRHWKHPLLRYDRQGARVAFLRGHHKATSEARLFEPSRGVITHHFPFRQEATTRARLEALVTQRWDGDHARLDQARYRWRTVEDVYRGRFRLLRHPSPTLFSRRLRLRPWHTLAGRCDASPKVWYSDSELDRARRFRGAAPPLRTDPASGDPAD